MTMDVHAKFVILANELTNDPLGRGYSGMSDAAAATDLNTVYRQRNKTSMTAGEYSAAIDLTEWNALTAAQRDRIQGMLGWEGGLDPFGAFEVNETVTVFGNPSATRTALLAARVEAISRATELGLPHLHEQYVAKARSL